MSSIDKPDGAAGRVGSTVVVTLGGSPVCIDGIVDLIIVIGDGLEGIWLMGKKVRNFQLRTDWDPFANSTKYERGSGAFEITQALTFLPRRL